VGEIALPIVAAVVAAIGAVVAMVVYVSVLALRVMDMRRVGESERAVGDMLAPWTTRRVRWVVLAAGLVVGALLGWGLFHG
jgi:hypothetical protein